MSISRRALLAVAVAVVAAPRAAAEQKPAKVARIGYLSPGQRSAPGGRRELVETFIDALKEHGWVEGENLLSERDVGLTIPKALLLRADSVIQ